MEKQTNSGTVIHPAAFHSNIEVNLDGTVEEELYDIMVGRMIEKVAEFQSMGSGWKLRNVIRLKLHTVIYNPLKGATTRRVG